MTYRIEFDSKAQKQLRGIPKKQRHQIVTRIQGLALNPRPHDTKKLKGKKTLYRIRSGDYRVVYTIEDGICLVLVVAIGNRKEVYEKLGI